VIQALAAKGANHPIHVCSLPWRPRREKNLLDAHCLHLIDEVLAENLVTVA
jgi:hypothetical protein